MRPSDFVVELQEANEPIDGFKNDVGSIETQRKDSKWNRLTGKMKL